MCAVCVVSVSSLDRRNLSYCMYVCITDCVCVCVCRLDNLIYGGEVREVVAVLDWELSTLGDPVSDLAYVCMPYHMDPDQPQLKGRYITRRMQNIFTWRANCSIIS